MSLPPIEEGASAGRLDGQHTGSVDRLLAELQERATAASAQVADLKRRLERSVEELERSATYRSCQRVTQSMDANVASCPGAGR